MRDRQKRRRERSWAEAARMVLENYSDAPMTPKQILNVIETEGLKETSGSSPLACLNAMLHSNSRTRDALFYRLPGRISLFTMKKNALQWSRLVSLPDEGKTEGTTGEKSSRLNEDGSKPAVEETSCNASCSREVQGRETRSLVQINKQKRRSGVLLPRVVLTPLKVNGAHLPSTSGLSVHPGEREFMRSCTPGASYHRGAELSRGAAHPLRRVCGPVAGISRQVKKTRVEEIDCETPGSILVNTNLRALINLRTFNALPTNFQQQLLLLLPDVDRQVSPDGQLRLNSSALNNEFFAHSCQRWRERLADGEFTPEMQLRIRQEMDKEDKPEDWKGRFFEDFYGQKMGMTEELQLEDNIQPAPRSPLRDDIQPAPRSPLRDDIQSAPRSPLRGDIQSAPRSPLRNDIQPAPRSPLRDDIQPAPRSPLRDDIQPAPRSPLREDIQPAPRSPLQHDVQSALRSPLQDDIQPAPISPLQHDVQSAPMSPLRDDIQPAPISPLPDDVQPAPKDNMQPAPRSPLWDDVQPAPRSPLWDNVQPAPRSPQPGCRSPFIGTDTLPKALLVSETRDSLYRERGSTQQALPTSAQQVQVSSPTSSPGAEARQPPLELQTSPIDSGILPSTSSRVPELHPHSLEQKRKSCEPQTSSPSLEKKPRMEQRQSFRNTDPSVHTEKPQPTKEEPKVPPIRIQLSRIKPPWLGKGLPAYQICPRIIPNSDPIGGWTSSHTPTDCQAGDHHSQTAIGGGGGPGGGRPEGRSWSKDSKSKRFNKSHGKQSADCCRTQLLPPATLRNEVDGPLVPRVKISWAPDTISRSSPETEGQSAAVQASYRSMMDSKEQGGVEQICNTRTHNHNAVKDQVLPTVSPMSLELCSYEQHDARGTEGQVCDVTSDKTTSNTDITDPKNIKEQTHCGGDLAFILGDVSNVFVNRVKQITLNVARSHTIERKGDLAFSTERQCFIPFKVQEAANQSDHNVFSVGYGFQRVFEASSLRAVGYCSAGVYGQREPLSTGPSEGDSNPFRRVSEMQGSQSVLDTPQSILLPGDTCEKSLVGASLGEIDKEGSRNVPYSLDIKAQAAFYEAFKEVSPSLAYIYPQRLICEGTHMYVPADVAHCKPGIGHKEPASLHSESMYSSGICSDYARVSVQVFAEEASGQWISVQCSCSLSAMTACKGCGAFCHNECMGPARLCVLCLVVR
ncbi:polycomb group protein ASXL1 isoform 2-T2 [Rhinophrynus dorsalis]